MTKAIRSYPPTKQTEVISRRLHGDTRGAGYWAARDALTHIDQEITDKIYGSRRPVKKQSPSLTPKEVEVSSDVQAE